MPNSKLYIWASFQTSKKRFHQLQEAICPTVINESFKFPPHFDSFGYVNYLYELSLGYPKYPTKKSYIWASFQTSRKRFRKLRKAIWLTVTNEISKFTPYFHLFCQVNYLYEFSSGYPKYLTQKWHIWAGFQTSRKRFRRLQAPPLPYTHTFLKFVGILTKCVCKIFWPNVVGKSKVFYHKKRNAESCQYPVKLLPAMTAFKEVIWDLYRPLW